MKTTFTEGRKGHKEHRQTAVFTPVATDVQIRCGKVIEIVRLDAGMEFRFERDIAHSLELSSQLEAAAQRVRG